VRVLVEPSQCLARTSSIVVRRFGLCRIASRLEKSRDGNFDNELITRSRVSIELGKRLSFVTAATAFHSASAGVVIQSDEKIAELT